MFEAVQFRRGIQEQFQHAVEEFRLGGYDPAIPGTLQFLAMVNEEVLMGIEERSRPFERRGLREAYESVTKLANECARSTVQRFSAEIEMEDLVRAYSAQFCKVWPFCR